MPDNYSVNDQRISLFLRKLWTLVNSPQTDNVIIWNEEGDGFIIKNQVEFCEVLPKYFKHNNFMSFVRQLHIYGFSKRVSDGDHTSNHGTSCEYAHPYFMKDHPCLLLSIKQKRGEKVQQGIKTDIDSIETISTLLKEVNSVKDKNKMLDAKFMAMKHENECLWRELAVIRQKHMKQQRILNQLIQFLVTLRQPGSNNTLCREVKNNVRYVLPIMHHKPSEKSNSNEKFANPKYKPSTSFGPVIHELDAADVLNLNYDGKDHGPILNEVVESEGVVLSPSSVSQMLNSPSASKVEEVFASNEAVLNSPLDELIREVSVSPTEELSVPKSIIDSATSSYPITESFNVPKKRTKKENNSTVIKKPKFVDNVSKFKSMPVKKPLIIKIDPDGDDPPVISIPEVNPLESNETTSNNDALWSEDLPSNSDNMQLVYPEPRQVIEKDGSSLIASNLNNSVFEKETVSKQIDNVQADLESLMKGLNDKYTFDANVFLNFINEDLTSLNLPMTSEEQTLNDSKCGLNVTPDNQIVSCLSPNTYDLNDLMTASADWSVPNTPITFDSTMENDTLNTPVISDSLSSSDLLFPNVIINDNLKK